MQLTLSSYPLMAGDNPTIARNRSLMVELGIATPNNALIWLIPADVAACVLWLAPENLSPEDLAKQKKLKAERALVGSVIDYGTGGSAGSTAMAIGESLSKKAFLDPLLYMKRMTGNTMKEVDIDWAYALLTSCIATIEAWNECDANIVPPSFRGIINYNAKTWPSLYGCKMPEQGYFSERDSFFNLYRGRVGVELTKAIGDLKGLAVATGYNVNPFLRQALYRSAALRSAVSSSLSMFGYNLNNFL